MQSLQTTTENPIIREHMMPDYVRSIPLADLPQFCEEIRAELINIVSKTGGHIGVNLGVIELTVALYKVFDFDNDSATDEDSVVWDIGHQIYIQKMLTGRLDKLREIRVNGGSPGYANCEDSKYDRVTSSHAGASLAFALGVMIANRQQKKSDAVSIAVIGDGSMVEGSSQEALNHMGVENGRMLCVLNDNEMALDNNFGGMHEYFKTLQIGNDTPETFFSSLGIHYSGPVDGHDVIGLVKVFEDYKENLDRPSILHIKTVKGKGLEDMAEKSPVRIHWNFPFDTKSLENTEFPKSKSHTAIFAEALGEILERDEKAYVVTPATLQNTGIFGLMQKYPDRVLDVGMAEQHAITVGCGLALQGMKPIVCFESTFLARTYDQIIHDLCINNLPVMLVGARSGHTGLDHVTHHSLSDQAYFRMVPNLKVNYPGTQADLKTSVPEMYDNLSGPSLLLFPYGGEIDDPVGEVVLDKNIDSANLTAPNLIISVGMQNQNAETLCGLLRAEGKEVDHVIMTAMAPLDAQLVAHLAKVENIITLEENMVIAGMGAQILETLNENGWSAKVHRFGFPKQYIEHGTRAYIFEKYGLDAKSVAAKVLKKI
ncbi:MAG: 1-deoxy-D-xylulose-5-phosphate synthase [Sphingomonadales bacterium]|nr:1-deoxy-D-xylulose-5-phosphate synthase [Sphingomonadales bacterium]